MKKMMMALAAVALASVASAVNFNWTATLTSGTHVNEPNPGWCGILAIAGDFSYSDLKVGDLITTDTPHTNGSYTFNTNTGNLNGAKAVAVVMKNTNTYAEMGTTGESSTVFTSSLDLSALDNPETVTFLFFNKSWGQGMTLTVTGLTEGEFDANKTYDLGTWNYKSQSSLADVSVPEPTVIALLVLGVAGVALRRKLA